MEAYARTVYGDGLGCSSFLNGAQNESVTPQFQAVGVSEYWGIASLWFGA